MAGLSIVWCVASVLMVFGLIETLTLGGLIAGEMIGAACADRLPMPAGKAGALVDVRLASLGFLLGHVFVGVAIPYLELGLVIPGAAWLSTFMPLMGVASGSFGLIALLAAFLAGLLAHRTTLTEAHDTPGLCRDSIQRTYPTVPPPEAA